MAGVNELQADSDKAVISAIRHLGDSKGLSLPELKQYLLSKQPLKDGFSDLESVQLYLANAVEKGLLSLNDGRYKIKETARRRRSRSRSRPRKSSPKRRSRSRKRSGSRKRRRSSGGRRRRRRSSSGRRKRSTSKRRRSRRGKKVVEEVQ